jgi:hypothetical protein
MENRGDSVAVQEIPPSPGPAAVAGPPTTPTREVDLVPSVLPDRLPMPRHLDPAATLAFRTPVNDHVMSADNKATALLTLLALMFTVLARFGKTLAEVLLQNTAPSYACAALLVAFTSMALMTVLQAFRTISPRFVKAPPSLAYFGDIARLSPDEYRSRVLSLDPEAALDHMLAYNHANSVIIMTKFRQFVRGLRFFRMALTCWGALVAVVAWRVFHG